MAYNIALQLQQRFCFTNRAVVQPRPQSSPRP